MKKVNIGLLLTIVISFILSRILHPIAQESYSIDIADHLYILFTLIAVFLAPLLLCIFNFIAFISKRSEGAVAERERQERLIISYEREQAIESQQRTEPWAKRYETSACPYCGHYKARTATWDDKATSVAFWGVASSAIGKGYVCDHCKKMW